MTSIDELLYPLSTDKLIRDWTIEGLNNENIQNRKYLDIIFKQFFNLYRVSYNFNTHKEKSGIDYRVYIENKVNLLSDDDAKLRLTNLFLTIVMYYYIK